MDGGSVQEHLSETVDHLADNAAGLIERTMSLIYQELPSYTAVPASSLQASVQRNLNIALRALRSGVEPMPQDLPEAEITVRERATQGVPVEDMMRAYRINIGVIQRRFLELAAHDGVSPDAVLAGARLLWAVGDAFTTRVALVYQLLSVESALRDAHRRSEFVRAVLTGTVDQTELMRGCALYGLDPAAQYAAVRARPRVAGSTEELRRWLERTGGTVHRSAVVGVLGGDCAGLVAQSPTSKDGWVVGIGPEVALAEVADSFRTASRVLEVAFPRHAGGVFGLADLSWRLAAAADEQVGRYLMGRYLEPLHAHGDFGRLLEQTLRAYLRNGLSISRTATELIVHVNTLRYRLNKYAEITGVDLAAIDVIIELAWALEAAPLEIRTTASR